MKRLTKISAKSLISLFGIIFAATFTYRILAVLNYNFAFTSDQARDMIEMRQIVTSHPIKLIGPITDIIGVYLGPFWYYFNLPAFILGQGSPFAVLLWQILWYQLSSLIFFLLLRKHHPLFALTVSCLFLLSPIGFLTSRYSFNANAMPIFTLIFFGLFFWTQEKPTASKLFLLGVFSGLPLQIQAALGIIYFPFSLINFKLRHFKLDTLWPLIVGFFLTLVPQIVFELSHKFLMTRSFINEIFHQSNYLGVSLTLTDRLSDRISHLSMLLTGSLSLPLSLILVLLLLGSILTITNKLRDNFGQSLLLFFSICLVFYLIYPNRLKDWYLYGLSVSLIICFSLIFRSFWLLNSKISQFAVCLCLLLITVNSFTSVHKSYPQRRSDDPSNLKNRLDTIETVYKQARGSGFQVYNFSPSVYDLPYQYLFWWYSNKFGYQPYKITYTDNVPEYIKDNNLFWNNKKPLTSNSPTFLIIEDGKKYPKELASWPPANFQFCSSHNLDLPWRTEVIVGYGCN